MEKKKNDPFAMLTDTYYNYLGLFSVMQKYKVARKISTGEFLRVKQ